MIEPDLVATARDRTGAYEGHPFVVEAGVSLGGRDAKGAPITNTLHTLVLCMNYLIISLSLLLRGHLGGALCQPHTAPLRGGR